MNEKSPLRRSKVLLLVLGVGVVLFFFVAIGLAVLGTIALWRGWLPIDRFGGSSPSSPPSSPREVATPSTRPSASGVETPVPDAGPPAPEWTEQDDAEPATLQEQRAELLRKLAKFRHVPPEQIAAMRELFEGQPWMGQGNPRVTHHPMTRAECRARRAKSRVVSGSPQVCGAPYMVPIYNPGAGEGVAQARVCIDQYEFPNIPCEYPVTWVPAQVAYQLCQIEGKRLCDAHEWEGACAGAVLPPSHEYDWGLRPHEDISTQRVAMQHAHNTDREIVWAYGAEKDHSKCATGSYKSKGCVEPTWERCGTNTYPAGAFTECVSPFGAYDLHGNVAEHMSFPMSAEQLGHPGQTEMKGSWFIFGTYEAHLDDCRWRAPDWHGGPVDVPNSHMNYHLGFRCCRDLGAKPDHEVDQKARPDAGGRDPAHQGVQSDAATPGREHGEGNLARRPDGGR